jgi:hypothetical protein
MRSLAVGFLVATVVLLLPGGVHFLAGLGSAAKAVLPQSPTATLCVLGAVVGIAIGVAVNRHRNA